MNLLDLLKLENEKRKKREKFQYSVNLSLFRIEAINRCLGEKCSYYDYMNNSEKIDFLIYMLEDFMVQAGMLEKKSE